MEISVKELPGKITASSVYTGKFKTNCLSVNFILPLERETVTKTALLRGLLTRGCEGYPSFERIGARMCDLYGASLTVETKVYGDLLSLSFTSEFLCDRYADDGTKIFSGITDMMRRIIFYPITVNGGFDPEYTENEKQRLEDEIKSLINEKGAYAAARMYEIMFEGGAGAIPKIGYAEDIPSIDPVGEYLYYKDLVSCSPVVVYSVGELKQNELENAVNGIFSLSERKNVRSVKQGEITCPVHSGVRTEIEEMDVAQCKLAIGCRTGVLATDSEKYAHMLLANEILGASPIAKLFMYVREELGLCYDCSSRFSGALGAAFIYAGVDENDLKKALNAIKLTLNEVKKGDFTAEELEIAKRSLVSAIRSGFDSPRYIISFYLSRLLAGVEDTPDELARRIAYATAEDVVDAASSMEWDTVYVLCSDKKAAKERL